MTQILSYRVEIAADDSVPVKVVQAWLQGVLRASPPPFLTGGNGGSGATGDLGGLLDAEIPPTVHMGTAQVKIGSGERAVQKRKSS